MIGGELKAGDQAGWSYRDLPHHKLPGEAIEGVDTNLHYVLNKAALICEINVDKI
jgi:hypothetical protein